MGVSVPTMSATQISRVSEQYRPKFPFCETCNARYVVSGFYIKTTNHSARLDLECPYGHHVWHMFLEPDAARSFGL